MKTIFKLIFSLLFLSLLINHFFGFQVKYFKYASADFINRYHLDYFYFYMMFVELVSTIIIFWKLPKWAIFSYDILLSIYCLALITALYTMYEITNGCIACHYIASVFCDNNYFTLGIVAFLGLLYMFYLRSLLFKLSKQ